MRRLNYRMLLDVAPQEANEQGHPGILAGAGKSNDFRLDGVFADYDGRLVFRLQNPLLP